MNTRRLIRRLWFGTLVLTLTTPATLPAQNPDPARTELIDKAYAILKERCHTCHGARGGSGGDLTDILDRSVLVPEVKASGDAPQASDSAIGFVVPGSPEKSILMSRITVEDDTLRMPQDQDPLPPEEIEIIRRWIAEANAEFPRAERPPVTRREQLQAIRDHLRDLSPQDRETQRYFTLTHLHNNPNVTDDLLRLHRAALLKTINSLSRESDLLLYQAQPDDRNAPLIEAVDEHQTVFNIDLRHVGWDEDDVWEKVLSQYPYGLKPRISFARPDSAREVSLFEDIAEEYQIFDGVEAIRADWFIVTATRPPLYHCLLGIPKTAAELEEQLGVNRKRDFETDQTLRGGVIDSGVSAQNRLVDRHPMSRRGSYWISYDFAQNSGKSNLIRFPLGPDFDPEADGELDDVAFKQAGGEIIFNLPNGLQGYMLIDQDGNRINVGPVNIVQDTNNTSGSPEIVNGLSCMACHEAGMRTFKDVIGPAVAVGNNDQRQKVIELFRADELRRQLERDTEEFVRLVDKVMAPVLLVGEDQGKDVIKDFAEPIAAVAKQYDKDLNIEDVAAELFVPVERLKPSLGTDRLRQLGLGPLDQEDGRLKRDMWQARDEIASPFQEAARALDLGVGVSRGESLNDDDC